jgi:hypothetical protein
MIEAGLKWALALSVCAALTGCIEADEFQGEVEADAQTSDTSVTTDGSTDGASPADASSADTQQSDAEATDAGTTDSGTEDAGTTDSGTEDAGTTDAGTTDSGTEDAGTTDSGTEDAGTTDSGTEDVANNLPPDFTELVETPSTTEGVELSYDLEATDPEDDSLTWTLLDGPPDLTIDSGTGTLTWTPGYNLVTLIGGSAQYGVEFTIADEASPPNIVTEEIQIAVYGDADEDGTMDDEDPCKEVPNESSFDLDNDALPDDCDDDIDGDGVDNNEDVCIDTADPAQEDIDEDGQGDACDSDMDGDEILNDEDDDVDGDDVLNDDDNCPETPNPGDEDGDQDDLDEDGTGDACDSDLDGDGLNNDVDGDLDDDEVPNDEDNCPWIWNTGQDDLDEDGEGDECDDDIDGDGKSNDDDWCPEDPEGNEDTDGDDVADCFDEDDDDDGYNDENDPCPLDVSDDDDLNYDVLNCGACGDPCDDSNGANVASWACDDGQCVIDACDDGYVEMQGCQEQPVIHVDAWNIGDTEQDGSEKHPFVSLQTAIDNSGDFFIVEIKEGAYSGPISIGQNGLKLKGVAKNLVTIAGDKESPVIEVAGDGVELQNLTTSGGSQGVLFSGGELSPLQGGHIEHVDITNVQGKGGQEADRVIGLEARFIADMTVSHVTVNHVTHDSLVGQLSTQGPTYGTENAIAIGASFTSVTNSVVHHLAVFNVEGKNGIAPSSCCAYYTGTKGVDAVGMEIIDSSNVEFNSTSVANVYAGDGGNGTQYGGDGGPGGRGVGMRVKGSTDVLLGEFSLDGMSGGIGGAGPYNSPGDAGPGPGDVGIGLLVQSSNMVVTEHFSITNVVGGGGVNMNARDGIGILLEEATKNTVLSYGQIAEIAAASCSNWSAGAQAMGIILDGADGTVMTGLVLQKLHGASACLGNTPQPGVAILSWNSTQTMMSHLTLHDIGPNSYGIRQAGGQPDTTLIQNSIFSAIDGAALSGDDETAEAQFFVSSSLFHECASITEHATLGSGILEKNPSFVAPDEGDVSLKPSSPAIDAGKDGSDYCNEPEPNGGAANLGAYGNTDEATSKIGSSHVPCDD